MSIAQKVWIIVFVVATALLIHFLKPVLTPFFASFILAYLGSPLVDRLERWKMNRTLAVVVVFVLTLLVLCLLIVMVIPMVVRETAALLAHLPEVIVWFQSHALPWLTAHLGVQPESLAPAKLMHLISSNFVSAGKIAGRVLISVSHSSGAVFAFFMNLVLIPVVTFYLLRDWNHLLERIRALIPRAAAPTIDRLARECDVVLGAFLRGQLVIMIVLSVFYSVLLSIIGLNNSVAIGVVAGMLSFVPYLGVITGFVLALSTALLQAHGWMLPVEVVVILTLGQLLSDLLLTPWLMGQRIGLHPVTVIFAILVGGTLFGFAGVLLSIPVAAAGTVLVRYARERYVESRLYQEGGEAQ